ncbi:MAG: hypothetical protein ABW189_00410 [Rickettsiales bacterium]
MPPKLKAELNQYRLGKPHYPRETKVISLKIKGVPENDELLRDLTNVECAVRASFLKTGSLRKQG